MPDRWLLCAILSAVAAAFVAIFAKLGMEKVDSTFATMVRSVVMTLLLLATCTVAGVWSKLPELRGKPLLMIILSGAAGAASWLFYFRAVQLGEVSKVAPIDKLSMPLGIVLAAADPPRAPDPHQLARHLPHRRRRIPCGDARPRVIARLSDPHGAWAAAPFIRCSMW